MKTRDVIISGGGIPGLTLAALLGRAGFTVTVLEPAPLLRPSAIKASGRTSALMNDSISILETACIWPHVAEAGTDLRVLAIIDASRREDFAAAELGKDRFGANIPNALLQAHAGEVVRDLKNVTILQTIMQDYTVHPTSITVTLQDGSEIAARLVVGADGRNSTVRRIAKIESHDHPYGQMAITALLAHTKSHEFTSTEFHLPGGPFTLVPMPGKTSSLVWVEHTDEAEALLRLSKGNFEQVLQDHSRGLLGKISLLSNPEAWPLKLMSAKAYTAPRCALIAEAAHVLSPIGAQGMNLSLRDVRALYTHLCAARNHGLDIGSAAVLAKYAKDRQLDTAMRVIGTHGLNQMVATDNPLLTRVRRAGFKAISAIPPLRAMIMDEGLNPGQAKISGRTTRAKVKTSTR